MKRNNKHSIDKMEKDAIKILAVGDIMLGISSLRAIAEKDTIPDMLKENPQEIVQDIKHVLRDSDILFGNLECIISKDFDKSPVDNPRLLMAPLDAVNLLKYANFTILNLANNHILDHGIEKVNETVKLLDKNGMKYVGVPTILNKKSLQIVSSKNKKIGFLGYNLCNDGEKSEYVDIFSEVKRSKELVDIIVVSLHWGWGYEHMSYPSPEQITLGRMLIDSGVDVVLGHHPHVIQPIELYKNKVIAYSLGNFIFDMWREETKKSFILEILISSNNNFLVNIVPIEHNNFKIKINYDDFKKENDLIVERLDNIMSNKDYRIEANKMRYKYIINEILIFYLLNFFKYSFKYHISTLSRWLSKIFRVLRLRMARFK